MDELKYILIETQKEYVRSNKEKDKIIDLLLVLVLILVIIIGGLCYYELSFETVETEKVTTTTEIGTEGDNASIDYNEVGGNQYNDSATHNEGKGGDK